MENVLEKLRTWRSRRALIEGVDLFRILSNKTLEDIAASKPKSKEDLLLIKGFKDKKYGKYGKEILSIVNDQSLFSDSLFVAESKKVVREAVRQVEADEPPTPVVFSVSQFLDLVNVALQDFKVKVRGEISSVDSRGNVIYFSLKDKEDGAMVRCLIWQSNYRLSGVTLEEGLEVIIYGSPNIWKPTGGMSFKAETIELVGEGALKKAYDELKLKLTKEGLFAPEKKRVIPEYPERIGLITSKTGAVIHDFLNNIGKFGYKIKFMDSRVEGQLAVPDLMKSIQYFKNEDIDVLVVIRGGGSLESLQAFNNEALTREIANFPKPVIAGIGHDKDVSLFALASDAMASTPTAVTKILNASWEAALSKTQLCEKDIFGKYSELLIGKRYLLEALSKQIESGFSGIIEEFQRVRDVFLSSISAFGRRVKGQRNTINEAVASIASAFPRNIGRIKELLDVLQRTIEVNSPERQLRLGYGIVRMDGRIVKSIDSITIGDSIDIQIQNGNITSEVKGKNKKR